MPSLPLSVSLFEPAPLPRPGPVLGVYPERRLPRLGLLERLVDRSVGALKGLAPARARRWRAVVRAVRTEGEALVGLDAAALDARVAAVRDELRRVGLRRAPCITAFALVRECARRTLGLLPYDEQILGGWAMLRGLLAEMQTGEGKTLAATLPAATAALAGIPVHLVTVNDYLVQRDAEQMGPLYRALGLRVGAVVAGMDHAARRTAYACDIVYCTNKQLVFDYLRDRMTRGGIGALRMRLDGLFGTRAIGERLLLRGLCFAIVDEADSVLIDEARTPLIISGAGDAPDDPALYDGALALAGDLVPGADYRVRPVEREVDLTDAGRARIRAAGESAPPGGAALWRNTRQREELIRQALYALHLLHRDSHYLVADGKVQIIDEYTGRLMPDRNWERGLHQLVEAKEGCKLTPRNETLARISYQRFFRRYLRLAGMTGTAREVAAELWAVYRLGVALVPTHRPLRRRLLGQRVLADAPAKWRVVAEHTQAQHAAGRPVLVGTVSVAASEALSAALTAADIPHRVLNARQDADEAAIVAEAGAPGQVTVATNMAGRGTDIRLGAGVAELGGLHVIATARHEARRIDRQLIGRCARQGDPGSAEVITALDDELLAQGRWLGLPLAGARRLPCGPRGCGLVARLLQRLAQRAAEARHARIRRRLLRLDEQVGRLLAFSGRPE
jgi:preprotein translocase subunit SecA